MNILRKLRKERNLTQADVGKALKVSPSAIGMYEQGRREPDKDTLIALANYFNVSVDYLVGHEPSFEVMAADRLPEEVVPIMKLAAELFQDDPAILDLLTKKASNLYGNKAWAESDITDMPEEKKTMIKLAIKAGLEAIEKK